MIVLPAFVRTIFRFLLSAHVLTAFYASCMTWYSLELNHFEDFKLVAFVFWSTLSVYNFHEWINLIIDTNDIRISRSKKLLLSFYVFLISTFMLFFYIGFIADHFFLILFAVVSSLLYTLPNLPQKPFRWLRKIAFAKTFFLAVIWTFVTVFIPIEIHQKVWNDTNLTFLLQRFFFIYAICILFDERDKVEDLKKGIRSISTTFNVRWTGIIYYLSVVKSMVGSILLLSQHTSMSYPTIIPSVIALFLFKKYQGNSIIYYDVFLDGLMALPAIIYFISQIDLLLHS